MDCGAVSNWDYIVVGGGSAGCVVAGRLSESGRDRVLLLEAGRNDRSPYIHVPAGMLRLQNQYWSHPDEPDPTRDGMSTDWLTGKVLGGGSSVNGLVWVRGNRADFDRWAELGATGWDFSGVLPYFKRAETFERGGDGYRGGDGPQRVSFSRAPHRLTDAFVCTAEGLGYPFNPDYNGAYQEGVAIVQTAQWRGFRHSAAIAYLGITRRRKNLCIRTEALASEVLFEGRRAVGVRYQSGGTTCEARASREVVLSAGTLASPKLLMVSGVGPAAKLREHGIDVVADNPGVGSNLQDHLMLIMMWNVDVPTFNMALTPKGFARYGAEFVLRGRGPAAASAGHAVVFLKLDASSPWPEIEGLFAPLGMIDAEVAPATTETLDTVGEHKVTDLRPMDRAIATVVVHLLHPRTRGTVGLRSRHAVDDPVIRHRFLGHAEDVRELAEGARRMREIMESEPISKHVRSEAFPGLGVQSDDDWTGFLRAAAWGGQHPVGTCRMGNDLDAAVDPQLRVRGVDGLRVVDASVMPLAPSGNTNAATEMIGEKGSEMILMANC
jgi:choline dehydrogenase-like flavoprotein